MMNAIEGVNLMNRWKTVFGKLNFCLKENDLNLKTSTMQISSYKSSSFSIDLVVNNPLKTKNVSTEIFIFEIEVAISVLSHSLK
jgi:hypothetical protein